MRHIKFHNRTFRKKGIHIFLIVSIFFLEWLLVHICHFLSFFVTFLISFVISEFVRKGYKFVVSYLKLHFWSKICVRIKFETISKIIQMLWTQFNIWILRTQTSHCTKGQVLSRRAHQVHFLKRDVSENDYKFFDQPVSYLRAK